MQTRNSLRKVMQVKTLLQFVSSKEVNILIEDYLDGTISVVMISSEMKCEMSGTASHPPTMTSRCDGEV